MSKNLDKEIKRLFFPRRKLYNYSSDRNLAASVVEELMTKGQNVKDAFNKIIHDEFHQHLSSNGTLKYDEFLLFCDPEELCKAAITSIENEK